jgi:hypothetical protein
MRKIIGALSLSSALIFALAVHAAAPNFAGTWTLDKSKSQGLNGRMQNADSVTWTITQNDKTITIEEKLTGGGQMSGGGGGGAAGAPPAGGAPAGAPQGGGGRGMGGFGGPRTYNLDGSETSADMGRGKVTRKATVSSDGNTLELVSKSTFTNQDGNEVTTTTTDKLSISGGVLTVTRHSDSQRGPQDSTLVFAKS